MTRLEYETLPLLKSVGHPGKIRLIFNNFQQTLSKVSFMKAIKRFEKSICYSRSFSKTFLQLSPNLRKTDL